MHECGKMEVVLLDRRTEWMQTRDKDDRYCDSLKAGRSRCSKVVISSSTARQYTMVMATLSCTTLARLIHHGQVTVCRRNADYKHCSIHASKNNIMMNVSIAKWYLATERSRKKLFITHNLKSIPRLLAPSF